MIRLTCINQARKYLAGSYQYCHAEKWMNSFSMHFAKEPANSAIGSQAFGDNVGMFVYGYAGFKNLEGADTIKEISYSRSERRP